MAGCVPASTIYITNPCTNRVCGVSERVTSVCTMLESVPEQDDPRCD
jgi:hypothetical protein